jgi:hypothetical protein
MERGLFRDEPLIIFIPIYCFLVFNFEFYFLQRFCTKVASLCAIGATLLQCAKGCWQPSGKFFTGGKRVLATLGQICNRVSKVIGNSLTNSPEGIDKFFKQHIFAIGLSTASNPWPEGIDYPPEQLSEGIR